MEKTLEIRVKLSGNLIEAYKDILKKYHTDGASLIRAYIVGLAKGDIVPVGYPKRVVLESVADLEDYEDSNTLIIPDHLKLRFPEYRANKVLSNED